MLPLVPFHPEYPYRGPTRGKCTFDDTFLGLRLTAKETHFQRAVIAVVKREAGAAACIDLGRGAGTDTGNLAERVVRRMAEAQQTFLQDIAGQVAEGRWEVLTNGTLFRSIRGVQSKLQLIDTPNALQSLSRCE